ncbi:uncharacterized protein [Nicotiana tomentosiformis]|uniref:uncharacterized protein n=1 Tax=Nicotiana tomentosiformis TaxID=4098 RepID=UPI00388C631B
MVGDKVFLKVSPMKGVIRFGKKGKLSPRFIGSYEIIEKKEKVAYELALPVELPSVNLVFHVSMLRKYIHDESHIIHADTIEVKGGLTYEEVSIKILDRQVRKLRTKDITLVKALWSNHDSKEAMSEVEEDMRKKYPYLFEEQEMARTRNSDTDTQDAAQETIATIVAQGRTKKASIQKKEW